MNKYDIENLMAQVPTELPEAVDEWIIKTCLGEHHYMFYDKKSRYAYCTSCRKKMDPRNLVHQFAKHREKDNCPKCGGMVEYICIGRFAGRNMMRDVFQYLIMQKMPDGILIRRFEVTRVCNHLDKIIHIDYFQCELQRRYNDGVKPLNLRASSYYDSKKVEWKLSKKTSWATNNNMGMFKYIEEFDYTDNMEDVLSESALRYAKRGQDLSYYAGWIKHCEYLEKMKLNNLVKDIISGSRAGLQFKKCNNIQSFLGVSNEDLKSIIQYDMDLFEINQIKILKSLGINKIDYQNVRYFKDMFNAFEIAKTHYKIDFTRFYYYSVKQGRLMRTYRYYADYLDYCKKLGYPEDDETLFPPNIEKAHDREMKRWNELQKETKSKAIQQQFEQYMKDYGFNTDDMMIRPPKDAGEIITEGKQLEHCVGSYVDRVSTKETTILFLRQLTDPDKPFYTIEWNKGLRQIRGRKNDPPTPEVAEFIKKWEQSMSKPKKKQKQASMAM